MSGITGIRILLAGKPELNIGGNHGSWNSAVAVRSTNSDHHPSRHLLSLDSREKKLACLEPAVRSATQAGFALNCSLSLDRAAGAFQAQIELPPFLDRVAGLFPGHNGQRGRGGNVRRHLENVV
jgi:hypothetical protein